MFRCDGGPHLGYGHLERCLAVAQALRENHRWKAEFAIRLDESSMAHVEGKGYVVHRDTGVRDGEPNQWLGHLIQRRRPAALVLDVRDDLLVALLRTLRRDQVVIATIDDPTDRRIAADLAFYPPVPQLETLDWTGFEGTLYAGWDWVILRPEFAAHSARHALTVRSENKARRHILVTMGGSDPAGLTLAALRSIDLIEEELRVSVVLGPGFMRRAELDEFMRSARRSYQEIWDVPCMAILMANADVAVASFGVTAYELAAMGVPAVHLCLTDDHSRSASALADAGAAINMGVASNVSTTALSETIAGLLEDDLRRLKMAECGRACLDGLGSVRVSNAIVDAVAKI